MERLRVGRGAASRRLRHDARCGSGHLRRHSVVRSCWRRRLLSRLGQGIAQGGPYTRHTPPADRRRRHGRQRPAPSISWLRAYRARRARGRRHGHGRDVAHEEYQRRAHHAATPRRLARSQRGLRLHDRGVERGNELRQCDSGQRPRPLPQLDQDRDIGMVRRRGQPHVRRLRAYGGASPATGRWSRSTV